MKDIVDVNFGDGEVAGRPEWMPKLEKKFDQDWMHFALIKNWRTNTELMAIMTGYLASFLFVGLWIWLGVTGGFR